MNKMLYRTAGMIMAIVMTLGNYVNIGAAGSAYDPSLNGNNANPVSFQQAAFYKRMTPGDSAGMVTEASGLMEKVTTNTDSWTCEAGGYVASTHYARLKYKLPEQVGIVISTVYMKMVVVLPADFYTQQTAGFRLMNTDNYTTTLNGVPVGAKDADESRTSVYINSNHSLRVVVDHENYSNKVLYVSASPLPVGQHTLELFGSLDSVAPWYLRVDGVVVASGTDRLTTDDTLPAERVSTRLVAGIDGAADQDVNPMNVQIKSFEVANYDMAGVTGSAPTPTTVQATATLALPTATMIASPTNTVAPATPVVALPTNTIVPTATSVVPISPALETIYDDKNSAIVYSSGWQNKSVTQAYGGSYKESVQNGSTITLPFIGQSFSILYKGGVTFSQFDVYVDGKLVTTLNEKLATTAYQQRWDYPGTLTMGNHTLKLVLKITSSKIYRGSLDAVIVRS